MKSYLLTFLSLAFAVLMQAQTITFTIDNFVGAPDNDSATTSETVGGVVYTLNLAITPLSGNVLSDDIGGGNLIFFESAPDGVNGTITADGQPLSSFTLVSAEVDAIGSSTYEWQDNNGNTIFSGSTSSGTVRTDNFSVNNVGISGFNINASNDFPGWHNLVITNPVVLPAELTSFVGKEKGEAVQLQWTTETEINNSHFIVEKSTDGRTYKEIAQVTGSGTTYDLQEYTAIDNSPERGLNYYRLRQVDFDGTEAFSEIVSVEIEAGNTVNISPNPVKDRFKVSVAESGNTEALIYNMSGQLIQHLHLNEVGNTFSIDTEALKTGIYNLQLIINGEITTQRFVKE